MKEEKLVLAGNLKIHQNRINRLLFRYPQTQPTCQDLNNFFFKKQVYKYYKKTVIGYLNIEAKLLALELLCKFCL